MTIQTQSRRPATGLVLAALAIMAAGTMLGFHLGGSGSSQSGENQIDMEPLRLMADTAARGNGISLATGLINEEVEGLFILDHLTGNLQCWVLNPRSGKVGGIYRASVADAFGDALSEKGEPDYVMAAGRFILNGNRGGNVQAADSVVYVAEGNSGKVVGFNVQYNKATLQRGAVQEGTMIVVAQGSARDVVTRE